MKKVKIVLLIISIIIIVLGIITGTATSKEMLNLISVENNTNEFASGVGANYSGVMELFGVFGAKLIGTMIILCSIIIDLLIWLAMDYFYFL